ncbi:MAG: histidine kinase [Bacteroidota bacterium]
MQRLFLFLLFLTTILTKVHAQQPIFVHLTEKEDLPDKEFYNVLEDDKGFIWLAADKGLYRYDGKEFKLFSHPEQVGLSVFSLQKDAENTIWYTNLANQVFCVKDGEIQLFLNLKKYFSGSLPRIHLHKDVLILSTIRKLLIVDKKTKEILSEKSFEDYLFNSELFIHKDTICFIDNTGSLVTIDEDFQLQRKPTELQYESENRIILFIDKINNNYVLIKRYLNAPEEYILFDIAANNEIKIKLKDVIESELIHKVKAVQNELFVASNNGVHVYRIENGNFVLNQHLLPNVSVSDVLKDSKGNLWFTTLFEGMYVVPNLKLNVDFQIPNGNTIRKLQKGKSNELFLIGKQKEFYVFNHDTNVTKSFEKSDVADIKYVFYDDYKSLYYLQTTKAFQSLTIENNTLNFRKSYYPGVVKDHAIISKDSLLLATGATIMLTSMTNSSNNKIQRYYNERVRSYSCFFNESTRKSYFGTVKGLFVFDADFTKSEITYQGNSIFIKEMVAAADGTLWCLSFKNGIYQLQDNQVVQHITVEDGLLTNINSFMQSDLQHNVLWIAGDKGLQQFDLSTQIFKNLTKKQGIPSYEFTGLEIIEDKVYVSTLNDLFSFHSTAVFSNGSVQKPVPYITSVVINDSLTAVQDAYTIPHYNEKIEIAFNTNGFLSNETITYEYRLKEGSQEELAWQQETSRSNKVVYNKLAEGTYTFQLRAKNGDQFSEIREIQFTVLGVFYAQWWFYLIIMLTVCVLIWYYFKKQNKRLQEKQQLLLDKQNKELENIFLKLESLRSQMNPHFIFNALNSIQDYILNNEKKLARTYLVKFSRLIRLYLEHSQKDAISLEEELVALNLYLALEKDRFEDSFEYEVRIHNDLETQQISIPTFLLQPYVENAIKHGLLHKKQHRKLAISIALDETQEKLICVINDNGIGRKASGIINDKKVFYPKSFSSDANAKRIELLNKTRTKPIHLHIEDKKDTANKASGTKVTLTIPLVF